MDQKAKRPEIAILVNGKYVQCDWLGDIIEFVADRVIEKQKTQIQIAQPKPVEVNLTVNEVAQRVNKSAATITRHIRQGLLMATKAGGTKSWVITQDNYINYKLNLPKRIE